MDAPVRLPRLQQQSVYQLLFEHNPLPMLVYQPDSSRVLFANEAAARCYGHSVQALLELHFYDIHHAEDWPVLQESLKQKPEQRSQKCWRQLDGKGNVIHVEIDTQDIDLNGTHARIVLARDVTKRYLAELERKALSERHNAIVDTTSEAIISTDSEGHIQTFNPGAERVFGYKAADVYGKTVCQLLPERFRAMHTQQLAAYASAADGAMRMMGVRLLKGLHADGHELDLEGSMARMTEGENQVLISILRDVSERIAADVERHAARTRLSHLTHRLMSQEKDLVKRIARVLHDQLGQTIATLRVVHDASAALGNGKTSRESQRLDLQMRSLIDQAIRQVRVVLVELQPPLLEGSGLVAALDNEMRIRAMRNKAMDLVLNVPHELATQRWESTCEYAVFMIAREALENAMRHSGASRLVVSVSGDAMSLKLEVQDNGRGIRPGEVIKLGHLGMAGMMERAKSIGATLETGPSAGGGTCVRLCWQAQA